MKLSLAPFENIPPLPEEDIKFYFDGGMDGYPLTMEDIEFFQSTEPAYDHVFWFATPSLLPFLIRKVIVEINRCDSKGEVSTELDDMLDSFLFIIGGDYSTLEYLPEITSKLSKEQRVITAEILQYVSVTEGFENRLRNQADHALRHYWHEYVKT